MLVRPWPLGHVFWTTVTTNASALGSVQRGVGSRKMSVQSNSHGLKHPEIQAAYLTYLSDQGQISFDSVGQQSHNVVHTMQKRNPQQFPAEESRTHHHLGSKESEGSQSTLSSRPLKHRSQSSVPKIPGCQPMVPT